MLRAHFVLLNSARNFSPTHSHSPFGFFFYMLFTRCTALFKSTLASVPAIESSVASAALNGAEHSGTRCVDLVVISSQGASHICTVPLCGSYSAFLEHVRRASHLAPDSQVHPPPPFVDLLYFPAHVSFSVSISLFFSAFDRAPSAAVFFVGPSSQRRTF